jgi:hypothetical protein
MRRFLCALAVLLAALPSLRAADRLVIVPSNERPAGLILPAEWMAQQRPARQDQPGSYNPALPTIIAGAAMTLGLVLTGLLLARRCSARVATGATACFVAGLLLVNSSCSSNDPRDNMPQYRPISGPSLQNDSTLQGEVLVEEGKLGDAVRLVIDPAALEALEKQHSTTPYQKALQSLEKDPPAKDGPKQGDGE